MSNNLKIIMVALVGYIIAGKLGLMLAIPPGFASAVWPASGLAFALMVIFKNRSVLIGVFLGSFLINFSVINPSFSNISFSQCVVPLGIAIGSTLQAYLTSQLFNFLFTRNKKFGNAKFIVLLMLMAVPIGCFVAPSVAVSLLFYMQIVPIGNVGFTWATWWFGDYIGVLLFTPLILVLCSNWFFKSVKNRIQSVIPTLILFTGVLLLFFSSLEVQKHNHQLEINEHASRYFEQIKQNFTIALNNLDAYSAYYNSTDSVTRKEFNQFSAELLKNSGLFQGIGWTQIIKHENREDLESRIKKEGFKDFEFKQFSQDGLVKAVVREEYYPVLAIYPFKENQAAFGLDLASNIERKKTLDLARLTGVAFSTAPIDLAQDENKAIKNKAIIVYLPIFDIQHNSGDFVGYISGILKVNSVIGDVLLQGSRDSLIVTISDVTDQTTPKWLIENKTQTVNENYTPVTELFKFSGRVFEIKVAANSEFKKTNKDWNSWIILTFGMLITSLLQGFIFVIIRQNDIVIKEVAKKTQALKISVKEAEFANNAKSDFLANMSHELRTPLNAILGLIHLCQKTKLDEQQTNYLDKADLASQTLLSLINHTLDYSKIEAGQLEIESVEFDFIDVLKKIYAIFNIHANQKNVNFRIICDNVIPDKLIGDSLRLEQVLINLCGNAIKFTDQGGVTVTVSAHQIENKHNLIISIEDTGIGIDQEQQAILFQPFKQADSSTSRKFGGTGLGLSISKKIIETMQGKITLESEMHIGSKFIIELNMITASNYSYVLFDQNTPATEKKEDDLNLNKQPLKGINILLVEDVMVNQMIAQEMLEQLGAFVDIADNGQIALDKMKVSLNVVLMDLQMPVMDGYESCKKIKEKSEFDHIPIIAMTANAMQSDIQKCKEAGMHDHISKPIDEKVMLKTILKYVNRK
ncbi:CHASE domain-containing protein [Marinicellulosiphila megalodicopiae]|uniref:CHASE domain-containing protein n=1 Tax=Marinicellulosiphila megalodicopiae TaxID=2724896 RepID=UPI003BAEF4A8